MSTVSSPKHDPSRKNSADILQAESLTRSGSSIEERDADVERPREEKALEVETNNWDYDPHNPMNWPARKKALQVVMISTGALLACVRSYP